METKTAISDNSQIADKLSITTSPASDFPRSRYLPSAQGISRIFGRAEIDPLTQFLDGADDHAWINAVLACDDEVLPLQE